MGLLEILALVGGIATSVAAILAGLNKIMKGVTATVKSIVNEELAGLRESDRRKLEFENKASDQLDILTKGHDSLKLSVAKLQGWQDGWSAAMGRPATPTWRDDLEPHGKEI